MGQGEIPTTSHPASVQKRCDTAPDPRPHLLRRNSPPVRRNFNKNSENTLGDPLFRYGLTIQFGPGLDYRL